MDEQEVSQEESIKQQDSLPISGKSMVKLNHASEPDGGNKKTPTDNPDDMRSQILRDVTKIFNLKIKEFFQNDFDSKLEAIVESRVHAITANGSSQNMSVLDQTISKNDHEVRISNLEELVNPRLDEIEKKIVDMASVISKKDDCIKDLLCTIEEMQSKNTELSVEIKKLHGIVKEKKFLHSCD